MTALVVVTVAYLALALILVYAIDNMVVLFFPATRAAPFGLTTLSKVIAVSRKYYRK
ncbi:hypothetical protein [Rhizobium grahamii]|uniref:hypothetical protein n=1 Tax=Rhizobium grahamii TaxID=1120045 RepID=UPI0016777D05|nr:hypothetical protein [Rhizobium grahamii]